MEWVQPTFGSNAENCYEQKSFLYWVCDEPQAPQTCSDPCEPRRISWLASCASNQLSLAPHRMPPYELHNPEMRQQHAQLSSPMHTDIAAQKDHEHEVERRLDPRPLSPLSDFSLQSFLDLTPDSTLDTLPSLTHTPSNPHNQDQQTDVPHYSPENLALPAFTYQHMEIDGDFNATTRCSSGVFAATNVEQSALGLIFTVEECPNAWCSRNHKQLLNQFSHKYARSAPTTDVPERPATPNTNATPNCEICDTPLGEGEDLRFKWITEATNYIGTTTTTYSSWGESYIAHFLNDTTEPSSALDLVSPRLSHYAPDDMLQQPKYETLEHHATDTSQNNQSPAPQQSARPAFRSSKSTHISHAHNQAHSELTHPWTFEEQITLSILDALSVRPFELTQAMQGHISRGGGRWSRFWNHHRWSIKPRRSPGHV